MINPPLLMGKSYYENSDYMSVSAYKRLNRCEYAGTIPFGTPTNSMLVGSYVDAFVEGTLEEFKAEHPEIISTRGASKGNLKADFVLADKICEYITNDSVFSQFMSGEKQTVMTGEIEGVPWKIKMDSYSPHIAINDLKCMATVTNRTGEYIDFITPWGYDIQMTCYQEIVYQNTGEKLPCYICAVTKEEPINSVIVNIPQPYLDATLYTVKQNAPHLFEVFKGNIPPEKCGHCKACVAAQTTTKIISLSDLV